jgi:hypothetical protein
LKTDEPKAEVKKECNFLYSSITVIVGKCCSLNKSFHGEVLFIQGWPLSGQIRDGLAISVA